MKGISFADARWYQIIVVFTAMVIVPFLIAGPFLDELFSLDFLIYYFSGVYWYGWLIGILLLISDLFLPIPNTIVMSALGFVYGTLAGGLISSIGTFLSGLTAYYLAARFGLPFVRKSMKQEHYIKGELFFKEKGVWIILLTRWLPVVSEVTAFTAGIARMPLKQFVPALICASLPIGFVYAFIGTIGHKSIWWCIMLSIGLPVLIWGSVLMIKSDGEI